MARCRTVCFGRDVILTIQTARSAIKKPFYSSGAKRLPTTEYSSRAERRRRTDDLVRVLADHNRGSGSEVRLRLDFWVARTVPKRAVVNGHAFVRPNVRAKRATTVGRQARAGENVPRTTSPGLVACRWRSA
jgi:hypothetical protein